MFNLDLYSDFLMDIFNLSKEDIEKIWHETKDNGILIFVTLKPKYEPCPCCGNRHIKIKGYVKKKITHSALTDRSCTIVYNARRYVCPLCLKTYYEENPFVFNSMKISIFTVQNILEDLHNYHETYTSVARRYHVSPTSVVSIFDSHVDIPRKPLPRYINFDEVYAFKSKHSKYVCVLLDFEGQTPIDVLPSRRMDYLKDYFSKIPREERERVEACCFDMYDTYRTICRMYFPNSLPCVDHFHVAQELHNQLQQIRIEVMKDVYRKKEKAHREMKHDKEALQDFIKYSNQYYLLKKFNWLLMKDSNDKKYFDPELPQKYNQRLRKPMNFLDIREAILDIDPILNESYQIKNNVSDFYRNTTYDDASMEIESLIEILLNAQSPRIRHFGHTVVRWKQEIINSFKIVKQEYEVDRRTGQVAVHEHKMNNAIIENKNGIIKCIKKNATGFTNWKRFRNRIMYVLNPKERYSLYPKDDNKKGQKT